MNTYLLETSVVLDVLSGNRIRKRQLTQLLRQGDMLAVCPLTVAEVYAWMKPTEAKATDRFLRSLEYYAVNWDVARRAGLLQQEQGKRLRGFTLAEATIAAVAIHYDLILIADRQDRYRMPGIRLHSGPVNRATASTK